MRLDELIVVRFSPNNYHLEVLDIWEIKKLKINLDMETWSYGGIKNQPFNVRTDINVINHKGIIGIYTKKTANLNKMIRDGVDAMRDY